MGMVGWLRGAIVNKFAVLALDWFFGLFKEKFLSDLWPCAEEDSRGAGWRIAAGFSVVGFMVIRKK